MKKTHDSHSQNVVFITYNKFPDGDAGAIRLYYFAKMLADSGKSVLVLSMGDTATNKEIQLESNISYTSLKYSKNVLSKIISYFLFPLKVLYKIVSKKADACLFTEVDLLTLALLHFWSKYTRKPLVYDAVEWYSPEQFERGVYDRSYKKNNKYNTKLIHRKDRVISISSYLYNHFDCRGIKTIRIPVLYDLLKEPVINAKNENTLRLIYAGSPGKKDYLGVVVQAISQLSESELMRLKFDVYGCTKAEFLSQNDISISDMSKLSSTLFFHGRVNHNEIVDAYTNADFSILIRSKTQRYAQAGFPTKFVESLSLGTPVIANLTSDIGEYLVNQKNGIVIDSPEIEDIHQSIRFALSLNNNELYRMKQEAYLTAKSCFDYRLFSESFVHFLV